MNKQELIKKYENTCCTIVSINGILEDLEQLDEPQKVQVPQIVADYIKYTKDADWDLQEAMDDVAYEDNKDLRKWFNNNIETFARAWLDGYTVEKEKRYKVSLKNGQPLVKTKSGKTFYLCFNQDIVAENYKFTRKELEEAGFGWVFDCEGAEVEKVE